MDELYSIEFVYTLDLDSNRVSNVIDMQYEFAEENDFEMEDDHYISVFEVLAVMSIRMEEDIMCNYEEDRTSEWFWDMMDNLELDAYSDELWNRHNINEDDIISDIRNIVGRWMDREYNPDGSNGGCVVLMNPRDDLREVDLWYQLMWWCAEKHPEEYEF